MKKRSLFWRLFSNFLAVGCLGLLSYFLIVVFYTYNSSIAELSDKTEIYSFFLRNLVFTLVGMVCVMAITSYYLGKKIAKPLELLREKANEAMGPLEMSDIVYKDFHSEEVAGLAKSISDLYSHLNNRVKKVTTQKNEQEAIFMSLSEGVIALSGDLKIKRMNTMAKKYFSLEERFRKDLPFTEAIREPELVEFVEDAMGMREPVEMEIDLIGEKNRSLKVTSAPYVNATSKDVGLVLVISDITKLKSLERHRIEFVANVSHELRTPLTSIQGYAETLLNPKVREIPEKQIEFTEKIKENSVRLKTMVEDLLYLASLDQNQRSEDFQTQELDLSFQVKRALEFLKAKAISENKVLIFEAETEAKLQLNEGLFGQALVNIIDNAIKYSGDSRDIKIRTYKNEKDQVCIDVSDSGIGISKEDQERLFERFYRVDKDRSRLTGGSGLGLAIVKNILDLHQIELKLKSELNLGTCFSLIFPT